MAFWSIAAPILGKVVGAIGANKAAKAQANAGKLDLGHLRKEAEDHGFNPLTVLQATGGAGSMTTAAAPGFLSFLAAQAPSIGETIGNAFDPQRKADLDLTRSQAALNRQMEAESIAQIGAEGSVAHGDREEDDYMKHYLENPDGWTRMRAITGEPIEVRNDILYRLKLPPGALYGAAEDAEFIFAEAGSEITGVGNIGDTTESLGGSPIVRRVEQRKFVKPDVSKPAPRRPVARQQIYDQVEGNTKKDRPGITSKKLPPAWLQSVDQYLKYNMWLDN